MEVLSALGLAVGLYLSLYPAMLLCPLLIMSHRVSSHTHTHTHTQSHQTNKHTEEGSAGSSGICSSDCCLVWPSVLCLSLPHWLLGLPPRHSRSHVSLTPSLITPSHPPPDSQSQISPPMSVSSGISSPRPSNISESSSSVSSRSMPSCTSSLSQ